MSASDEGDSAASIISKKPVPEEAQVLAPVSIDVILPEHCCVGAVEVVDVGTSYPCHNHS